MIYRAIDCGSYEQPDEPAVVAWVGAVSYEDAKAKLTALLALTFDVKTDSVIFSNVQSEIDLERVSLQPRETGDRRWLEEGSLSDWPLYIDPRESLVFLNARERNKLRAAATSARAHARELYGRVAEWAQATTDKRHKADREHWAQQFLDYANGETRL